MGKKTTTKIDFPSVPPTSGSTSGQSSLTSRRGAQPKLCEQNFTEGARPLAHHRGFVNYLSNNYSLSTVDWDSATTPGQLGVPVISSQGAAATFVPRTIPVGASLVRNCVGVKSYNVDEVTQFHYQVYPATHARLASGFLRARGGRLISRFMPSAVMSATYATTNHTFFLGWTQGLDISGVPEDPLTTTGNNRFGVCMSNSDRSQLFVVLSVNGTLQYTGLGASSVVASGLEAAHLYTMELFVPQADYTPGTQRLHWSISRENTAGVQFYAEGYFDVTTPAGPSNLGPVGIFVNNGNTLEGQLTSALAINTLAFEAEF